MLYFYQCVDSRFVPLGERQIDFLKTKTIPFFFFFFKGILLSSFYVETRLLV